MKVKKFALGPVLTNLYVVSENGRGFIVDAADKSDQVTDYIKENNIDIDFILQTHSHFDHVLGLEYYKNLYDIEVYASIDAKDIANNKNYNLAFDYPNLSVPIDKYLEDGEVFSNFNIKAIKTPGHSIDSMTYLVGDYLFTGDTLFNLSIGRTDLPGGDYGTIMDSLNSYRSLSPDLEVYSGHGSITNLAYELANNPFLN